MSVGRIPGPARLFDAHCHLQDRRISAVTPQIIRAAANSGIDRFAVNGVSEDDWHLVKRMADEYPSVIPCFGLHPWYIGERSPNWFEAIKGFFDTTPAAAVGEIGLDKGSHGKQIDFTTQVQVFQQQLELSKELQRPVSIHCVRAYGDLLEIMQHIGPFPAGAILHSYMGSVEMIPRLATLGSYFSFSGYLTFLKEQKAKKIVQSVPIDKILLETDAPDGLPKFNINSLIQVPRNICASQEPQSQSEDDASPKETLNHPANICSILRYVAGLLGMAEEELAEITYRNATRVFCYQGSKISSVC